MEDGDSRQCPARDGVSAIIECMHCIEWETTNNVATSQAWIIPLSPSLLSPASPDTDIITNKLSAARQEHLLST